MHVCVWMWKSVYGSPRGKGENACLCVDVKSVRGSSLSKGEGAIVCADVENRL